MHSTIVALAFAAQALAYSVQTEDAIGAPVATGQPIASYKATLQAGKPGSGYIAGTTGEDGLGVEFTIDLTDLPDDGPFGMLDLAVQP